MHKTVIFPSKRGGNYSWEDLPPASDQSQDLLSSHADPQILHLYNTFNTINDNATLILVLHCMCIYIYTHIYTNTSLNNFKTYFINIFQHVAPQNCINMSLDGAACRSKSAFLRQEGVKCPLILHESGGDCRMSWLCAQKICKCSHCLQETQWIIT